MKNAKGKHTFDGTKMNYIREDRQYIQKISKSDKQQQS